MKRLAIILGLLLFAQASFAGGTTLIVNPDLPAGFNPDNAGYQEPAQQLDPNSTYFTKDGIYSVSGNNLQPVTRKTYTTRKFRIGRQHNDPNGYWNFGRVNFGNGFTSVGSGDKKY